MRQVGQFGIGHRRREREGVAASRGACRRPLSRSPPISARARCWTSSPPPIQPRRGVPADGDPEQRRQLLRLEEIAARRPRRATPPPAGRCPDSARPLAVGSRVIARWPSPKIAARSDSGRDVGEPLVAEIAADRAGAIVARREGRPWRRSPAPAASIGRHRRAASRRAAQSGQAPRRAPSPATGG